MSFERADPRLRYIRQPTDIGAEANFRAVLEGSDDAPTSCGSPTTTGSIPDTWQRASRCSRRNPDNVIACGRGRYYRGGALAFSERPVNLLSGSRRARLLGFFRTVTLNGVFYGVIRRDALPALPVRRTVGADWLLTAALAYAGPIRTLDTVAIHRAAEGASQDGESLRRAYGLSRRQARHWYAVVAREAFREIRTAQAYGDLHGVRETRARRRCRHPRRRPLRAEDDRRPRTRSPRSLRTRPAVAGTTPPVAPETLRPPDGDTRRASG